MIDKDKENSDKENSDKETDSDKRLIWQNCEDLVKARCSINHSQVVWIIPTHRIAPRTFFVVGEEAGG